MANKSLKFPENERGRFYVDESCIDCDLCRSMAPANFKRADDKGYSFVFHQPATEEELSKTLQALKECPVAAIGSDGATTSEKVMINSDVTEGI